MQLMFLPWTCAIFKNSLFQQIFIFQKATSSAKGDNKWISLPPILFSWPLSKSTLSSLGDEKVIPIISFNQEKKSEERTNERTFHLVMKQ